jgi:tRNA (Thr-GGU) A37 N-methylase
MLRHVVYRSRVLPFTDRAPPRPSPAAMAVINLQVLRDNIATESVDLIYLDPPFNSKATYTYNVRCWTVSRPQFPAA